MLLLILTHMWNWGWIFLECNLTTIQLWRIIIILLHLCLLPILILFSNFRLRCFELSSCHRLWWHHLVMLLDQPTIWSRSIVLLILDSRPPLLPRTILTICRLKWFLPLCWLFWTQFVRWTTRFNWLLCELLLFPPTFWYTRDPTDGLPWNFELRWVWFLSRVLVAGDCIEFSDYSILAINIWFRTHLIHTHMTLFPWLTRFLHWLLCRLPCSGWTAWLPLFHPTPLITLPTEPSTGQISMGDPIIQITVTLIHGWTSFLDWRCD